jgi:hypothetical protein
MATAAFTKSRRETPGLRGFTISSGDWGSKKKCVSVRRDAGSPATAEFLEDPGDGDVPGGLPQFAVPPNERSQRSIRAVRAFVSVSASEQNSVPVQAIAPYTKGLGSGL